MSNNQKLREALEIISRTELPSNSYTTEAGEVFTFADGNTWLGRMRTVVALAKAALAAPLRNCDRFSTVADAWNAHNKYCAKYKHCHKGCPLYNEEHFSAFECFEDWLFSEAKGGAE